MINQPVSAMPPIAPPTANAPATNPNNPNASHTSVAPSGVDKLNRSIRNSLVKTIVIILLVLLLVGALLLAVYFYNEYQIAKTDVDGQVAAALITKEKQITDDLEAKFAEREKIPYSTFTGPDDYGRLSFKYPKTWNSYIAKDAAKGGDYEAYLDSDPNGVPPVSQNQPFNVRILIKSESFENANNRYNSSVTAGKLKLSIIQLPDTSVTANRYDGQLPNNLTGTIVIFKIRDKVVTLECDKTTPEAAQDFDNILQSIKFNE